MISLGTIFWLLVGFFGLIGALRGWTKEVIATSGLVLSLFALNQFGFLIIDLLGSGGDVTTTAGGDVVPVARQQFYILSLIHLTIAFFSYQGPAIAGRRIGDRLRVRDSLQDKVLGLLVGSINGYLIVGTLLAFLEYRIIGTGTWERLQIGVQYPFDPTVLTRPAVEAAVFASLFENLPLPLLAPYLPFLVVIVFLFVIIVMI